MLRHNGREVALTALMRTSQQVCFYIYTTYVITYATTVLGFGRGLVLNMVMTMALVSCFANPLFGHLSDLYGRRTITAIGLRDHDGLPVHLLRAAGHAVAAARVPRDCPVEPDPGYPVRPAGGVHRRKLSRLRCATAAPRSAISSRRSPRADPRRIIATLLLREYGTSTAIASYIAICSVISLICVFLLKDRRGSGSSVRSG